MQLKFLNCLFVFSFLQASFSQTVVNGDFDLLAFGWGCSPEASFFETTYGGSDPDCWQ